MDANYYEAQFPIEDSHWWYLGRRRVLRKILSTFSPEPSGVTLEVGCGGGGNLALLSDYSAELKAVEMEPAAVAAAKKRGLGDIQQGKLGDALPLYEQQYDLIAMLDVLEHIDDDAQALRQVHALMAKQGRFIVSVPAYPFLWTRHDEVAHHCRRYTRKSLVAKLEAAGFEVKFVSYFNTLLFPLALVTLLYARLFGIDPEAAIEQPVKPLNALFRGLFSFESRLLPTLRMPFGLSIVLVAETRKSSAS